MKKGQILLHSYAYKVTYFISNKFKENLQALENFKLFNNISWFIIFSYIF